MNEIFHAQAPMIRPVLQKSLIAAAFILAAAFVFMQLRPAAGPVAFASGNGRLEATEVDVSTKMAGRVAEILAREGDSVNRGQVLARLELDDLQAQSREALAQVAQSQAAGNEARAALAKYAAELQLAKANLERSRQLVAKNFISADKVERDMSAVQVAESALASARSRIQQTAAAAQGAQARVERMDALLSDGKLTAPLTGRVLYRLVEAGEVVGAGAKLLTLLDLGDVYMTVYLPTELAGRLSLGDEARLLLDALPEQSIPARVMFVADKAQFTPREVETRTEREKLMFRIKVKVDATWLTANAARVKPGMPGIAWLRLNPQQPWPQKLGQK